jgi:hypothetical protein
MQIFIVRGATGEYSDHCDWPVKAFASHAEAASFAAQLVNVYEAGTTPNPRGGRRQDRNWKHPLDPHFYEDYTGTDWYIEECELEAKLGA